MLLDQPLDSHPLEPNVELPTPSMLKRKIIIKNKKKHHHHHHHHKKSSNSQGELSISSFSHWHHQYITLSKLLSSSYPTCFEESFHRAAYLHNLINQFHIFFFLFFECCVNEKIVKIIETATNVAQLDKQQPPTIDENCATGSNLQQTANGDIPQQHAPPLQVRLKGLCCFSHSTIVIIYVSERFVVAVNDGQRWSRGCDGEILHQV